MDKGTNNVESYRAASVPRSPQAVNVAVEAFHAGVRDLRAKFGIMDVLVGVQVAIQYDDSASVGFTWFHIGAEPNAEIIAARMLGETSAERRKSVNEAASGNARRGA